MPTIDPSLAGTPANTEILNQARPDTRVSALTMQWQQKRSIVTSWPCKVFPDSLDDDVPVARPGDRRASEGHISIWPPVIGLTVADVYRCADAQLRKTQRPARLIPRSFGDSGSVGCSFGAYAYANVDCYRRRSPMRLMGGMIVESHSNTDRKVRKCDVNTARGRAYGKRDLRGVV